VQQQDSRKRAASDLPDVGHVTQNLSREISAFTKNNALPFFGNRTYIPRNSPRSKRDGRVVTDVEAGCDGRKRIVRRAVCKRTAKPCGPGTPGLVLSVAG